MGRPGGRDEGGRLEDGECHLACLGSPNACVLIYAPPCSARQGTWHKKANGCCACQRQMSSLSLHAKCHRAGQSGIRILSGAV